MLKEVCNTYGAPGSRFLTQELKTIGMANPRVFISSTCYDLSEVRDSLIEFIESFGFIPVLSERGDVFYHPDIHTHDSCLKEVTNCDLFILIIGGRFGGTYDADKSQSIVNAEYAQAREQNIPVFAFVKKNVYSDHHVYSNNKSSNYLSEMNFPSIDKKEDAKKIFEFIDKVRLATVDNGFFSFEFARDIVDKLRKQWSGMFFDFLHQRRVNNQFEVTTNMLQNISDAGKQLEELVKKLYRQVDESGAAESNIQTIENYATAKKFFSVLGNMLRYANQARLIDPAVDAKKYEKWFDYFAAATGGVINQPIPGEFVVDWPGGGRGAVVSPKDPAILKRNRDYTSQHDRFNVIKSLPEHLINAAISETNDFTRQLYPNIEFGC